MQVELVGGPLDGLRWDVEEEVRPVLLDGEVVGWTSEAFPTPTPGGCYVMEEYGVLVWSPAE